MYRYFVVSLLFTCVVMSYGCSSEEKADRTLMEANRVHLEAVKLHHRAELKLDSLRSRANGLPSSALDSLAQAIEAWESQLIGVQGFESGHSHEGHVHSHAPIPDLLPAQMLLIQKEFLKQIKALAQSLDEIAPML